MLELKRLHLKRVVATPEALDSMRSEALVFRTATDEALTLGEIAWIADPFAIVMNDGSFVGLWLSAQESAALLRRHCEWAVPEARPVFTQGAIAGIACKLYLEQKRSLLMVPACFQVDFVERLA